MRLLPLAVMISTYSPASAYSEGNGGNSKNGGVSLASCEAPRQTDVVAIEKNNDFQ